MSGQKSKRKTTKGRNVVCITYVPLRIIKQALKVHYDEIRAFAYIYHDKDLDENGELKEPHFHLLLRLYRPHLFSAIKRWFWYFNENEVLVNTFVEPCSDVEAYYHYLIHTFDPDKFQYDPVERMCSDPSLFLIDSESANDSALSAFDDVMNNVPYRVLAQRYGRDFIYHWKTIHELRDIIIVQEAERSCLEMKEVEELPF